MSATNLYNIRKKRNTHNNIHPKSNTFGKTNTEKITKCNPEKSCRNHPKVTYPTLQRNINNQPPFLLLTNCTGNTITKTLQMINKKTIYTQKIATLLQND